MWIFCVTKMKHSLTIWFCRDELSLAMLFWEDMIAFISMLEVLLFLMSIWTFILNHSCLNIHAMIRYMIKIMLGSIPHQKLSFLSFTYSRTSRNWAWRMLICLRRIYNFLLFHANIIQLLYTFGNFLYYFLGLTYWSSAQCQFLSVACFMFRRNPISNEIQTG